MLPNYAPWCGLEAYQRGVIVTNYFCEKGKKLRKYVYGRSRPYIYLLSHFFWVNMPCRGVLHSVNSIFNILIHTPLPNFGQRNILVASFFHSSVHLIIFQTSTQKLYRTTVVLFIEQISHVRGICVPLCHFGIETMTFTLKNLSGPLLGNYKCQLPSYF